MLGRGRSAEALESLNRMEPSPDALTAIARACLLLDKRLPEEAEKVYQQVVAQSRVLRPLGETTPLLAGQRARAATNCARLLEAIPAQHPEHPALQFMAGQSSWQEFLDRAGASRYQRCSAHRWIALGFLAQGDRHAARDHFAQSVETGIHWLMEFQWSRAFLARMQEDRLWPPWIGARTVPRP